MVIFHTVTASVCTAREPPLSGSNPVPDSHFTASSSDDPNWAPHKARINATLHAWCASQVEFEASPSNFFIQVKPSKSIRCEMFVNIVNTCNIISVADPGFDHRGGGRGIC